MLRSLDPVLSTEPTMRRLIAVAPFLACCVSGRAAAQNSTVATVANGDSVSFAATEHAFPQRVGYCRLGRDSVLGWTEGTMRGSERRVQFPYRRVVCAAAP